LEGCAKFGFVIQIGPTLGVLATHAIRGKAFVFDFFEMLAGEVHAAAFQMQMSLRAPSLNGEWAKQSPSNEKIATWRRGATRNDM
jgi:hypothetical protein